MGLRVAVARSKMSLSEGNCPIRNEPESVEADACVLVLEWGLSSWNTHIEVSKLGKSLATKLEWQWPD